MTHPPAEQLSDLLDDALPSDERSSLQSHLEECPDCTALLEELRRVVARAQSLEDRPPRQDLWPGVAAAIGSAPPARRRLSLSVPQLLAAGIALMLFSGGAVALLLGRGSAGSRVAVAPRSGDSAAVVPVAVHPDRGYDAAVRELAAEVDAGRGRLDTLTVRVVRQKLELIDRAIAEAERALAADPANSYLHGHLTQTRMRKLDLLRRAAQLTRAVS